MDVAVCLVWAVFPSHCYHWTRNLEITTSEFTSTRKRKMKKSHLSFKRAAECRYTYTESEVQVPISSAAGGKTQRAERRSAAAALPVKCSTESQRTWNFFTLWGPATMMSMWAGSLFAQVSWLHFKVILLGVPWPLLHAHRVFSSFAWTRHNKSTLITGP